MGPDRLSSRVARWLAGVLAASLTAVAISMPAASAQGTAHRGAARPAATARAAGTAATPTGVVFGGFSSQHLPSFFQVSKNGRMLVVGSLALWMKCSSGSQFMTEDDFQGVPISANGKLTYAWAMPPTKQSDGVTFGGSGTIKAAMDRRRSKFTGVWHVHDTFISASGQTDECDSGQVRFTALQ
jgi:hypothetical protein